MRCARPLWNPPPPGNSDYNKVDAIGSDSQTGTDVKRDAVYLLLAAYLAMVSAAVAAPANYDLRDAG